jgi:hypothetical protein
MPVIRLTREDILQTKLVDNADWYPCRIDEFKAEASKTDQSTNYVFYCKIEEGKEKDVPVRVSFSEKFLGPFKGFAEATGEEISEEGGNYNPEAFKGRSLMIFVEAKENARDKKIYNTPSGFMSKTAYEAMTATQR